MRKTWKIVYTTYEVLFTPTHQKKIYFNLSSLYISKLCCKEEYVLLLYGDIKHNADNTQNV